MAPRMLRDHHFMGDPCRYSLRTTTKHSENNSCLKTQHVDISQINGKEDFFRSMGLRLKRLRHKFKASRGDCRIKTVNIPANVTLRDCSVVILGETCKLCGRCFKCKTDMNIHTELKHRPHFTRNIITEYGTEYKDKIYETFPELFECGTVTARRSSEAKLHKKLRLTLRIGKEVVAKTSVKRKHLKTDSIYPGTQSEVYNEVVRDIDPSSIFCNSPCQCCNLALDIRNSSNRYLNSNIARCEGSTDEEAIVSRGNEASNKPMKSRSTSANMICGKNCDSFQSSVVLAENSLTLNKESHELTNSCAKWRLNSKHKNEEKEMDINANEIPTHISCYKQSENTTDSTLNRLHVPQICLTSLQHQSPFTQQSTPSQQLVPRPQLPMSRLEVKSVQPLSQSRRQSVPSQQPSNHHKQITLFRQSSTPEKQLESAQQSLMSRRRRSTSPQQLSTPRQRSASLQQSSTTSPQLARSQQPGQQSAVSLQLSTHCPQLKSSQQESMFPQQLTSLQQQVTNTGVEHKSDDEVQEVLRIVRGYNNDNNNEINHESPNRYEQEMLLRDIIDDMKKMERRGWCFVERKFPRKRRRAATTCNSKNGDKDNEFAKTRRTTAFQANVEQNVRNSATDKYGSNEMGYVKKVQDQNEAIVEDNLKENFAAGLRSINDLYEVLRGYGINFYNDTFETNKNQESGRCFLIPRSARMENRSNRPIVIDLVNDNDE